MNSIEAALRRIAADLDGLSVGWALVGGFAVSARAEPRLTRDVDVVVVSGGDADAEKTVRALLGVGYLLVGIVEQEAAGRLATVRLASPGASGSGVVVDVIFATAGVEAEVISAAERTEILPGLRVPVARAGHLVALKLLARDDRTRPQDAVDLRALAPVLDDDDRTLARQAVELIEQRGFARGRPLVRLLEEYLDDTGDT